MTSPPARSTARPGASRAEGSRGAVATGHPLATEAALEMLRAGGNAADAAIAAHAMLSVVLPDACGAGGDALFLVAAQDGTSAVNGTGVLPARASSTDAHDAGESVTVPGAVGAWERLAEGWGKMPLENALSPAIRAAEEGVICGVPTRKAIEDQHARLMRGGADSWDLLESDGTAMVRQPALAGTLRAVAGGGARAFYTGWIAEAVVAAVNRDGGHMELQDLEDHETVQRTPIRVPWMNHELLVQPPQSQGVLLAMAAKWLDREIRLQPDNLDHVTVEATKAAFDFRDDVARGEALLHIQLDVDRDRASRRTGARGYLHTAGVATADADGLVVSSLCSVFDDFGAGTFVPQAGFVLNNRAGGFTSGPNRRRPGHRPVHTLAPAIVSGPTGTLALATPGADGQVQTIIQVLAGARWRNLELADAVSAPRWRSEGEQLLCEAGLDTTELTKRGHRVVPMPDGDVRSGAVVAAGVGETLRGSSSRPFAVGDWRRQVSVGAC